jgi:hypothetical protein
MTATHQEDRSRNGHVLVWDQAAINHEFESTRSKYQTKYKFIFKI